MKILNCGPNTQKNDVLVPKLAKNFPLPFEDAGNLYGLIDPWRKQQHLLVLILSAT